MEALKPPKTLKVYQLVKQSGLYFTNVGSGTNTTGTSLGVGFFGTQHEAEMHRTMEVLKLGEKDTGKIHVFELEIPNPAYEE